MHQSCCTFCVLAGKCLKKLAIVVILYKIGLGLFTLFFAMMRSGWIDEFSLVIVACRCAFRTMSSYRQLTAITLVSASIFYVWYRYCRVNSESSVLISMAKKVCS